MSEKTNINGQNQLNPIQKEAVEWKNSSVLVLAGPGSGKTSVLTFRIAKLLESTKNKNFRVLGLTFTNKAADEMRSRLNVLIPNQIERLFLGTYHSFCAEILRQDGSHLGIKPNFNIYSQDNDLKSILKSIKNEDTKFDVNKMLKIIQILKERLILPENSKVLFNDEVDGKLIAHVYSEYERKLGDNNALDFNSLILKSYELLNKFPVLAKKYQTIYHYICLDEFQDTNYAQYSFLKLLTGEDNNNLFLVADDDQIIYQWNGANPKRIKDFIRDYSPKVFQLPMNYRCPPEIIELANNLIRNNFSRADNKQPLEAHKPKSSNETVRLLTAFSNLKNEANGIAKEIKLLHSDNLGAVVILGRNRSLLEEIRRALTKNGIKALISQRKDEFESTPLIWIHSILKLVNNQHVDVLEAVCGTFAQFTKIVIDPEIVITSSQTSELGYLQNWINLVKKQNLDGNQRELIDKTLDYLGRGKDFQGFSNYAIKWFTNLVEKEELANSSEDFFSNYEEEKVVWNNLMKEITQSLGNNITLEAFLQELQMHSKETPPDRDTVVLMTIHGAKGKEFDHVYLAGLVEGELPSFQSLRKGKRSPEMEEERRNCFVAITRAEKSLTMTYAKKYRGWNKKPSRFLYEMEVLNKN